MAGLAVVALVVAASGTAAVMFRPDRAIRVATGFVAHIVCAKTFVSGFDPQTVFAETTDRAGIRRLRWVLGFQIDRTGKTVDASLTGLFGSRAVFHEGLGCVTQHGPAEPYILKSDLTALQTPKAPPLLPEIAGAAIVEPADPKLKAALDHAFEEPASPPFRRTKAVVVAHNGRVIAERYADGVGVDTPLLGFSATKSVISALAGILVRKGALKLHEPVPIAAWQGADDPRRAITLDHLIRHTAGLALGSSLQASLASALEPVNRMKFMESDMAAYAESMPLQSAPGTAWNYHDGNTVILSHVIRQASGGSASKMMRLARQELFDPLGMRNVTLEFDASGNAEGSSQMLASARDWARFGQLYLNDGVAGGKRILPEGWVKYSASPTPNAWVGQGAGFWTNLGDSFGATYRTEHGWPRDAFFAKGTIGQYVIIVPSERLVIVRLGRSPNGPPEADGVFDLVREVVAAMGSKGKLAGAN